MAAFTAEALHEGAPDTDPEEWLERRLADPGGAIAIWEDDGRAVSIASCGNSTPNGVRVGPVYTPPRSRGRGYGSAVTAAVTDSALARRSPVLLPVHRPREPDVERDLPADRLRAGDRRRPVGVRPIAASGLSLRESYGIRLCLLQVGSRCARATGSADADPFHAQIPEGVRFAAAEPRHFASRL